MKMLENKKGQEEIVGFVAIVVIVSAIFLIFLAISVNNKPDLQKQSQDVNIFLNSIMHYTSDCAVSYEPAYSSIQELIKECRDGKQCLSGKSACETLNYTVLGILDSSWQSGLDRPIKGYFFSTYYDINSTSNNQTNSILSVNKGNCSSNYVGAENFFSNYPGNVITSLKICY